MESAENPPVSKSAMADFISRRLQDLKGTRTLAEIAGAAGFTKPAMLLMFADGSVQVPLDRVLRLAEALETRADQLGRLALQQFGLDTIIASWQQEGPQPSP